MSFLVGAVAIWAVVNILTYMSFKIDKAQAMIGAGRIPEASLLAQALFGGSLGAKIAQRRFRHKTRKQPFRATLNMICGVHLFALAAGLVWLLGYWPTILAWVN